VWASRGGNFPWLFPWGQIPGRTGSGSGKLAGPCRRVLEKMGVSSGPLKRFLNCGRRTFKFALVKWKSPKLSPKLLVTEVNWFNPNERPKLRLPRETPQREVALTPVDRRFEREFFQLAGKEFPAVWPKGRESVAKKEVVLEE